LDALIGGHDVRLATIGNERAGTGSAADDERETPGAEHRGAKDQQDGCKTSIHAFTPFLIEDSRSRRTNSATSADGLPGCGRYGYAARRYAHRSASATWPFPPRLCPSTPPPACPGRAPREWRRRRSANCRWSGW